MEALRREKTGIGFLLLLCLAVRTSALYNANSDDMEQVRDVDMELKNFLFDCTEHPWISPCNANYGRKYLMLFNDKGNYLKETLNRTDETKSFLSASLRKKARKPRDEELMGCKGYPPFLFQLERDDASSGTFYIATSSGKLLVAGDENLEPSLLLNEDHCTRVAAFSNCQLSSINSTNSTSMAPSNTSISNANLSPITSTIAPSNISISMGPNPGYDCKDQALWTLWKVGKKRRFLAIQSVHQKGFFFFVADRKVTLNEGPMMMTGMKTSFLSNPNHQNGGYTVIVML